MVIFGEQNYSTSLSNVASFPGLPLPSPDIMREIKLRERNLTWIFFFILHYIRGGERKAWERGYEQCTEDSHIWTSVIQPPWLSELTFNGIHRIFKWNQHSRPMKMYCFAYLNISHIQTRAGMVFRYVRVSCTTRRLDHNNCAGTPPKGCLWTTTYNGHLP